MTGALKYIYQQFPPAFLSEVKFIQSAGGVIFQNLDQIGARYVYYQYIYIQLGAPGAAAPALITFNDQFGVPIFSCFNVSTSGLIYAPLMYAKESTLIKITCSSAEINFSVSYQYVISKDKVNLKTRHNE
jgi:hypothetical protein